MSPKNSLSFNMSPTSAIIFIKCRNCHHMKNSIRFKGNINNTSVIIFLIESQLNKTPSDGTCLGEPPGGFCDVGCHFIFNLHFIFDLHFVVVLHLSMFFIHICFSTSSLTLPWTIAEFLHPFYTFIPVHRSSIIIEVITTVLNFLFFFYDKILKVQKSIKSTKKH